MVCVLGLGWGWDPSCPPPLPSPVPAGWEGVCGEKGWVWVWWERVVVGAWCCGGVKCQRQRGGGHFTPPPPPPTPPSNHPFPPIHSPPSINPPHPPMTGAGSPFVPCFGRLSGLPRLMPSVLLPGTVRPALISPGFTRGTCRQPSGACSQLQGRGWVAAKRARHPPSFPALPPFPPGARSHLNPAHPPPPPQPSTVPRDSLVL